MLPQDTPDDYVISTMEQYSVRAFVELSAELLDMKLRWEGEGMDEVGIDDNTGNVVVKISPRYFRDAEVDTLLGDSTKARTELGWKPEISFRQLVEEMIDRDMEIALRDQLLDNSGYGKFIYEE